MDPDKTANHSKPVSNTGRIVPPVQSVISNHVTDQPAVRKVPGRGVYSMPSILDALKEEPKSDIKGNGVEDDGEQYLRKMAVLSFSRDELLEAWKSFVATIDAPQLKSALNAREPYLTGPGQIEFELDTELQFNRLTLDLKPKLLGYLRRRFENESIEILFTVSDGKGIQSGIPYTEEERWNLLVSRYPALATLKSKFGLDFEHY